MNLPMSVTSFVDDRVLASVQSCGPLASFVRAVAATGDVESMISRDWKEPDSHARPRGLDGRSVQDSLSSGARGGACVLGQQHLVGVPSGANSAILVRLLHPAAGSKLRRRSGALSRYLPAGRPNPAGHIPVRTT